MISGLFGNGMTRAEYQQQQTNSLTAQAMQAIIPIAQQVGAQPAILKLIESDIGQQMMTQGADFDAIASVANLAAAGKVREARARAFGQSPAPEVQSQPQAVGSDQWAGMRAAGEALPQAPQPVQDAMYGDAGHYVEIAQELFATGDDEGGKNALALANTALQIEKELKAPTTDDLKEYQFYVEQRRAAGAEPLSFFDYQLAQKKAGAQNITIGGQGESAFMKKLGEKTAESWSDLQTQGRVAASMHQDLEALEYLLKIAPQQPGLEFKFSIPQTGIRFPGLASFTEGGQAFQSIIKRIAPQMRAPGSGSTSDIEYQGFLDSLPSLGNHIGANRYITAFLKAKAQLDIERSAIVDMAATGEIPLDEARKRMNAINARSILTDPDVEAAYYALTSYQPSPQREPERRSAVPTPDSVIRAPSGRRVPFVK